LIALLMQESGGRVVCLMETNLIFRMRAVAYQKPERLEGFTYFSITL
jgi:hypothetical protein